MISVERLEQRMAELGLNPHSTAKLAGTGQDYVRDILRGKVKQPSAAKLHDLALALDCSPEFLMGLGESPGEKPFDHRAVARAVQLPVLYKVRDGFFERHHHRTFSPDPEALWVVSGHYEGDEWLERVVDTQAGKFIEGSLLHVFDPATFDFNTPFAVVERHRDGGRLVERTVRRVEYGARGATFSGTYPDTHHTLDDLIQGTDPSYGKIVGAVRRAYLFLDGGIAVGDIPF